MSSKRPMLPMKAKQCTKRLFVNQELKNNKVYSLFHCLEMKMNKMEISKVNLIC